MKTVDRYIGVNVIGATLTVLFVLLAIFSFFTFIDELEEIGKGTYTLGGAAMVVALKLPGLTYELFPIAALIGALLGLGSMMERNEIAVVRCAGVSKLRMIGSVMKSGFVFVVAAVLIGELVFPAAERMAQDVRTLALADRVGGSDENGFWARDGSSYINIREILPDEEFRDINIYEFDDARRLQVATWAKTARYVDGQWQLNQIRQTHFEDGRPVVRHIDQANWDSLLAPDLISMIAIEPGSLSLLALVRYVDFAHRNGQNAQRWEHALWTKLGYPLATAVMVFLAIPLVLRNASRSVSTGRRILVGALIGLAFHILNQTASHLGIVFGVPAVASALGPTGLVLALGLVLNYRVQ